MNADRLSAGEWVIATGNPFFLATDGEAVVTLGAISGLGTLRTSAFSSSALTSTRWAPTGVVEPPAPGPSSTDSASGQRSSS